MSKNYRFWGQVMKFFLILQALNQQRLIINNDKYIKEIRMIKRFVSATQACLYTVVCTINVSIDCNLNEVPNLNKEKNILDCNSSQSVALFFF